jgi:hypothetical protein
MFPEPGAFHLQFEISDLKFRTVNRHARLRGKTPGISVNCCSSNGVVNRAFFDDGNRRESVRKAATCEGAMLIKGEPA